MLLLCLFANSPDSHSVREVTVRATHQLVPGRKNIPPMNHLTKIFPRATVQGGHKYWSRTDIIANICSTEVDAENSHVQKIFSCLMPMSLMRVQCGTTFKIRVTTFMLGIITRLSFTQEYRIFNYKQVDNVKEAGQWCCLRQMASAAREFSLFSVLDIWSKFVGDLHWRQAQSCLTARVESPYPALNSSHKEGSEQLCWKTFWPRHPGDPLGPPQTPLVPPRIPPGFRQHCWWKCTSTASHTWHGGCVPLK